MKHAVFWLRSSFHWFIDDGREIKLQAKPLSHFTLSEIVDLTKAQSIETQMFFGKYIIHIIFNYKCTVYIIKQWKKRHLNLTKTKIFAESFKTPSFPQSKSLLSTRCSDFFFSDALPLVFVFPFPDCWEGVVFFQSPTKLHCEPQSSPFSLFRTWPCRMKIACFVLLLQGG